MEAVFMVHLGVDYDPMKYILSPLTYCFERANGNNLQTVWTENKGRESLMYVLKNVEKYFTSKGVPTVIGEFGACHKENEADRADWA